MKKLALFLLVVSAMSIESCKKCYQCTCQNPSYGCPTYGYEEEICDKGLFGKLRLTGKVSDYEDQGYTCTVK